MKDATQLAQELLAKHGNGRAAFEEAMWTSYRLQTDRQLYELSVWREVKAILRRHA